MSEAGNHRGVAIMVRTNNVNLEAVKASVDRIKDDPSKAKTTQAIEGEWILAEGRPQFISHIKYEGGETTFETDNPTAMGGFGTLPGPMHFCFFGLASCYAGIFATAATELGIKLDALSARVEADMNFSPILGISEDPIMEEIRITLRVKSKSDIKVIRAAERLAKDRCPAVYTMHNQIPLVSELKLTNG